MKGRPDVALRIVREGMARIAGGEDEAAVKAWAKSAKRAVVGVGIDLG